MMERLTQWVDVGKGKSMRAVPNPKLHMSKILCCLNKLAEYEDLEERGLLVRLPCKVGDTVYYINTIPHIALYTGVIYEAVVVRLVTIKDYTALVIQIRDDYGCTEIPNIKDFGKTVFLTREEAEQALKELEE